MRYNSCVTLSNQATRRCGGTGRRKGLKIPRWQHRAGSTPASGTKKHLEYSKCFFAVNNWLRIALNISKLKEKRNKKGRAVKNRVATFYF